MQTLIDESIEWIPSNVSRQLSLLSLNHSKRLSRFFEKKLLNNFGMFCIHLALVKQIFIRVIKIMLYVLFNYLTLNNVSILFWSFIKPESIFHLISIFSLLPTVAIACNEISPNLFELLLLRLEKGICIPFW